MPEEVLTLVRIPIIEIEKWIKSKHNLPKVLTDFRIDGDALVLYFSEEPIFDKQVVSPASKKSKLRRRRSYRKRNRMKTRGWQVVGRITNSRGQKCTIYKPFVDALENSKLTPEEQKKLVEKILRSNRNRPSEASIQYFLENTLEYLQHEVTQEQLLPQNGTVE
jgi:hypothetical protein